MKIEKSYSGMVFKLQLPAAKTLMEKLENQYNKALKASSVYKIRRMKDLWEVIIFRGVLK